PPPSYLIVSLPLSGRSFRGGKKGASCVFRKWGEPATAASRRSRTARAGGRVFRSGWFGLDFSTRRVDNREVGWVCAHHGRYQTRPPHFRFFCLGSSALPLAS